MKLKNILQMVVKGQDIRLRLKDEDGKQHEVTGSVESLWQFLRDDVLKAGVDNIGTLEDDLTIWAEMDSEGDDDE